ncbi:MAG: 2-phospho-L-lactate transferase [Thermoleophilaceae bacterium]|nr:2-phospho-L-lactate transferase [Thermoleophilaceae bacterium]
MIVLLAGGTGGAKLAAGIADAAGPDQLAVIANTGDDHDFFGVHVSPDPDLVTWWLAGSIDARGWGIEGDTWGVMEALEAAGAPAWFRMGDRDLAMCLIRTAAMVSGRSQTEAHAEVVRAAGVGARVIPMSDEPVRTRVLTDAGWRPFQEFMIVDRAEPEIRGVKIDGADRARPSPEALAAIETAQAIVIGPSNPVVSIGPILAVPGMREAIERSSAPVVAVSPWVGGRAVKGPTDAFASHAGLPRGAAGAARAYAGLIDGLVADEPCDAIPALETPTLMSDRASRRRVAAETLQFAATLSASG